MSNFSPEQIRSVYIERCKEPAFSINLKNATDARIKNACKTTYQKKNNFSDKLILRNFLRIPDDGDVGLALKRADAGKFRPIVNFFKNETTDPREETIDLVMWLIDFNAKKPVELSEPDLEGLSNPPEEKESQEEEDKKAETKTDNQDEEKPEEKKDKTDTSKPDETDELPPSEEPPKTKKPIFKEKAAISASIAMIIVITSGLASLLFSNKKDTTPFLNFTGQEKYMYWLGDHYQPTNRSQIKDTAVIPFEAKKVSDFKKITDPDTLTTRSIGKVWYAKINNKPEFYTSVGFHPGDTLKILRPLTKYMVDKYTQGNSRLLLSLNSLFFVSLLVFLYSTIILYKKRTKNDGFLLYAGRN